MEDGQRCNLTNKNITFDKSFWKSFGWFLFIAALICCLPWAFADNYWGIDFSETGQIGDTIGGVMGPFIAIAAAGLTFIAFWVQYKANIQQRHDISIERFESNLFEMIHIQQEITNGLVVERQTINSGHVARHGRDVFEYVYRQLIIWYEFDDGMKYGALRDALASSEQIKQNLQSQESLWFLDHYFRHLYRIFKYIDDADINVISPQKKYEYASIVRATLSSYELVMIFYNGFSHPKFKGLIEDYAIFNNLRCDMLASSADKALYAKKFDEAYKYSDDENRDMTLEYKKGAFVYKGVTE